MQRLHVSVLSMAGKFAEAHGATEFVLKTIIGTSKKGISYR
jgi:hypothetical protein